MTDQAIESILAAIDRREKEQRHEYEERVESYLMTLLGTIRGVPSYRPEMVAIAAEQLGFSRADVEFHINLLTTQGEQ